MELCSLRPLPLSPFPYALLVPPLPAPLPPSPLTLMLQWLEYCRFAGVSHVFWYDTARNPDDSLVSRPVD